MGIIVDSCTTRKDAKTEIELWDCTNLLRDVTFTILQLGMTKEFLHGPTRMMSRGRDRAVY